MSQSILLSVRENLTKNSKINSKRIDILIKNMNFWKIGDIVYPNFIRSSLRITYEETYELLDLIRDMGILDYCYQLYCHICQESVDYPIIDSLNQLPEKICCEKNHKLSPINDIIVLYRVIKYE